MSQCEDYGEKTWYGGEAELERDGVASKTTSIKRSLKIF